ncbi:hypothetical protein D5S17_00015 [Pseudonocardiaceae bacterium YIM PH 21723]|nr:hypothetical protein D5S17_00015 [Pseudonocardiaceae bacterium YIM PH 21723]
MPRTPFVLMVMGLLGAGLIASLWLSTLATADAPKLEAEQKKSKQLSEQVELLQRDVAAAGTPGALAKRAQELGMQPAPEPAHLLVNPDGSVTVVGKPKAAPLPAPPVPQAPPSSTIPAPPPAADGAQAQQPAAQAAVPPPAGGG